MAVTFEHVRHPHIEERGRSWPVSANTGDGGFNGWLAIKVTSAVGTMWCAYVFAVIALVGAPEATRGGVLPFVDWVSQTFIQLVLLSVVMVGQNLLGRAADQRAEITFRDAEAAFHEAQQIQEHLHHQDRTYADVLARLERIEAALTSRDRSPG